MQELKCTDLKISCNIAFSRRDTNKVIVWPALWNLLKHELFVCGCTVCCHLSLTTGGKKQQMFSDWPVPLGTASVQAQNNGFYTDKKQSQHNKRLKITPCAPWKKMFVIQGKKIIWRTLNEQSKQVFLKEEATDNKCYSIFNDFSSTTIRKKVWICFV